MLSMDWIGGFFDADGSVGLTKRTRGLHPTYVPILSIGQSDKGILEAIGEVFELSVYLHKEAGTKNSQGINVNRDAYNLLASNSKAIIIAKSLIPVTHCKTKELQCVIDFYEKYSGYTKGWARYKNDEYYRRASILADAGEKCREELNSLRKNKDTTCLS